MIYLTNREEFTVIVGFVIIFSRTTAETLVHASITSSLGNCNSLLHDLQPNYLANRVQPMQNAATRLISIGTLPREQITSGHITLVAFL